MTIPGRRPPRLLETSGQRGSHRRPRLSRRGTIFGSSSGSWTYSLLLLQSRSYQGWPLTRLLTCASVIVQFSTLTNPLKNFSVTKKKQFAWYLLNISLSNQSKLESTKSPILILSCTFCCTSVYWIIKIYYFGLKFKVDGAHEVAFTVHIFIGRKEKILNRDILSIF